MTLNGCTALGGRDFNVKVAISRKRCEIGPRLQLITNRKSYTGFDLHRKQWPWMTLSTRIEVFYGFYICSQWAFIHALLSRVPFASAGLSCYIGYWVNVYGCIVNVDRQSCNGYRVRLTQLRSIWCQQVAMTAGTAQSLSLAMTWWRDVMTSSLHLTSVLSLR